MESCAKRCRTCAGLKSISVFISFPCSKRKEAMPKHRKHANQRSACSAQAGGHTWGLLVHWKIIKMNWFSYVFNKNFQLAEQKTLKSELRWQRPGGSPYVRSLAARPPEPPGRPAPHRRRVASARNDYEIKNIAEFFILQIMKSMKCSLH